MMSDDVALCEHEGCRRPGNGCWLPEGRDEPTDWLCSEHAIEAGYCGACGMFWAGVDSFDFGNGWCENCRGSEDYGDESDEDDYERWCLNEDEKDSG